MSEIKIVCTNKKYRGKSDDAEIDMTGREEFKIEANQLFMNTKDFFNTVRSTMEKYFDTIEKK